MRRIRLIVSYDGTNYCGWQIQENAVTVEGTLTDALRKWLKEDIEIIGASRTDSGVQAYGNIAVFDTNSRIPAEFGEHVLNCPKNCGQCTYCEEIFSKAKVILESGGIASC